MMSKKWFVGAAAAALSWMPGCSADDDDAPRQGTCAGYCANQQTPGCALAGPEAVCIDACERGGETYAAQCSSEWGVLLGCLEQIPFTCDESGLLKSEAPNRCIPEYRAQVVCAVCVHESDDDECETCNKARCCTEVRALAKDPAYFDWSECVSPCVEASCLAHCDKQFPGLLSKALAGYDCQVTQCDAECS